MENFPVSQTAPAVTAEILDRRLVYDGWYRFWVLRLRLPDGAEVERHLLDNGQAVAVLPYDAERRVAMLITQPRVAVLAAGEPDLLEAIAGNLDGAPPAERVLEEAMEEGGLRLAALEPVANIWPIPPVSTERVMLYLAPYAEADRVGEGGGHADEHENIRVVEIALDELYAMVMEGRLEDGKTLALAQALIIRHPELFTR
jgi:nudix-type nucleoside diphosphatase (YffH/AdpP family)